MLHHWLYHHAVRSPFDLQRRVRVFFIDHLVRSVENLLFDRSLGLNVLVGRVSQVAGGGSWEPEDESESESEPSRLPLVDQLSGGVNGDATFRAVSRGLHRILGGCAHDCEWVSGTARDAAVSRCTVWLTILTKP